MEFNQCAVVSFFLQRNLFIPLLILLLLVVVVGAFVVVYVASTHR